MIRFKQHGGEQVKAGHYWNFSSGERVRLDSEGILPGEASVTYLKCHPAALLFVAPFMGLVYAMFLPLIGIGMLLWFLGQKLVGGVLENVRKAAVFSWQPGAAYFAGNKHTPTKAEDANEDTP